MAATVTLSSIIVFDQAESEQRHVIFVKVHKASSSTVQNIFLRFAMSRDLNVMLGSRTNVIKEQSSYFQPGDVLQLPAGLKYDILCSHLIFNQEFLAPYFPPDVRYVAIVREPFSQFVSAFNYYLLRFRVPYLKSVLNSYRNNSIHYFLKYPKKFEYQDPRKSFTNNRMSVDLGFPVGAQGFHDTSQAAVDNFIRKLDRVMDLVLVTEYFDESIILMRRLFRWSTKDVLYLEVNSLSQAAPYADGYNLTQATFTEEDRRRHRAWAVLDYQLYQHFLAVLRAKIRDQGPDFMKEVNTFQTTRRMVKDFCMSSSEGKNSYEYFPGTEWSRGFYVTQDDCLKMQMGEVQILGEAKQNMLKRLG